MALSAKSYRHVGGTWLHSAKPSDLLRTVTMPFCFPRFRLFAFCRDHIVVGILAVFAGLFGGAAVAAPGQLDPTFGNSGKVILPTVRGSAVPRLGIVTQRDGKYVVGGTTINSVAKFYKARVDAGGVFDTTYTSDGQPVVNDSAVGQAVALTPDGKFVLAGQCGSLPVFCVSRYLNSSQLDVTFAGTGSAITSLTGYVSAPFAVAIDARNRIVMTGGCSISGQATGVCLIRYKEDGSLDTVFGGSGVVTSKMWAGKLVLQPDGKIVLAGLCLPSFVSGICVSRFLSDGSVDYAFGVDGSVAMNPYRHYGEHIVDLAIDDQNRLLIGGRCDGENSRYSCMRRLLPNGFVDFGFGHNGTVNGANDTNAMAVQDDGKIVLAKSCPAENFRDIFCVTRYRADGSLDIDFGVGGTVLIDIVTGSSTITGLTIDRRGDIVLSGICSNDTGSDFCLARIEGGPYAPASCTLNIDGNLALHVSSDALLLTRYLLGYRGAALTTGALGHNSTRTGQALETYLASLNLDADGDGQTLAMTDGLLILRAMLGLTGTALTQGATNTAHPNVRNAQQILTWIESTHGVACLP